MNALNRPQPGDQDALPALWEQHRARVLEQVDLIARAITMLGASQLDEGLRREARRSAHMLSGSIGMFGFTRASDAAHQLELELATATPTRVPTMSTLIAIVRRELEGGRLMPRPRTGRSSGGVLVVDEDRELGARIAAASASRDMPCETVANAREARAVCAECVPAIVLLNLAVDPEELADAYALLSELSTATPSIPVLVLTASDAFADRVEAARRGSRAFLSKTLTPDEVWSSVERFLARDRLAATRVLVVDDDPVVLDITRGILNPHDLEVFTLADPLRFWETLEEVEPELLVLDVNMPSVNGLELCRTVRNDPRWSGIAVIFATSSIDADTIELVFSAGADDYIAKPIVGPELVARVSNRLERVRLYRAQAETDGLTGLSNRVTSEGGLEQLAALSDRFSEPLSVVMLDLDRFKHVNDSHGHAAGDRVLRRIGDYLRREFRGSDVVGRWGGEEFIVGMYGMSRANAVRRLADMQARFSREEFPDERDVFHVSFSAGVAEYPLDGSDTDAVCQAADEALYRAKAGGGAHVAAAETTQPNPRERIGQAE
jgi:diguanylate cyclase (GGDEF)-like protein